MWSILLTSCLIVGTAIVVCVWVVFWGRKMSASEDTLRESMRLRGRYPPSPDVEEKTAAGEGTIIYQSGSCDLIIWWTEDDVIAAAPEPIPKSNDCASRSKAMQLFGRSCLREYTDLESGTGVLIDPASATWDTEPRISGVILLQTREEVYVLQGHL
jgi:hypothetical protein